MSQLMIVCCDQCDKQKGETNHWVRGWEWSGGISFAHSDTRILDGEDVKDFCGQ